MPLCFVYKVVKASSSPISFSRSLSSLVTSLTCSTCLALTAVADVDGTETELSGKLGGTFNVSEKLGVYGEVSTITNGDEDRNYGTKLGAKFTF